MILSHIVIADENNGIGKNNQLLCHLPADLAYFKRITSGHHILMGRNTYESIGRPLPNRTNMVMSRNAALSIPGCIVAGSIEAAVELAKQQGESELFITGGGNIYAQSMNQVSRIYLTRIHHTFDADTFYPEIPATTWKLASEESHSADEKNKFDYSFQVYERMG